MARQRGVLYLFHLQNLRGLFHAAEGELRLVASFLADELFAERRLRGDDEDFFFVVQNFRAARARADKINGTFAAVFQFHQRANIDGVALGKFLHAQFLILGDGGFEFRRLLGLTAREVGGFEAARVVFIFRLVGFVRGFGAGELRGAKIDFQFADELGGDLLDDGALVHE